MRYAARATALAVLLNILLPFLAVAAAPPAFPAGVSQTCSSSPAPPADHQGPHCPLCILLGGQMAAVWSGGPPSVATPGPAFRPEPPAGFRLLADTAVRRRSARGPPIVS